MNIKKPSRFTALKTKVKAWFNSPWTRHIVSGLVIVSLNNVLNGHLPAPIAAEISKAAGAIIEGQQQ
jgi:hypothetical protein